MTPVQGPFDNVASVAHCPNAKATCCVRCRAGRATSEAGAPAGRCRAAVVGE